MIVISVVAAGVAITLLVFGLSKFDRYCAHRFGHRFFTRGGFVLATLALLCLTHGHRWAAQVNAGDALNGFALMAIGGGVALAVVVRNVRRTSLAIGTMGSALQLSVFGAVAWVGMLFLAAAIALLLLLFIFGLGAVKPVWVVNR